ncbi:hypothetical protein RLEG12_12500 [Rhizobium leguminosarum bv. trifolii CB782]|nr:hypothetical protein RLEG12_12500 [Rhizobium leguminosarum bv. trifolii CB782]
MRDIAAAKDLKLKIHANMQALEAGQRVNTIEYALDIPSMKTSLMGYRRRYLSSPLPQPPKVGPQIFSLHSLDRFGEAHEESVFSRYFCAMGESRHNQRLAKKSGPDQFRFKLMSSP